MKLKLFVAIIATLGLTSCLDSNGESKARYEKCMGFEQGVTLDELRSEFGQERQDLDAPVGWHIFESPGDYQLLYSDTITARTDPSGAVVSLSCAEFKYAFGGP